MTRSKGEESVRRPININCTREDGWSDEVEDAGEIILISRTSGSASKQKLSKYFTTSFDRTGENKVPCKTNSQLDFM
jgi:hypothetical protein